MKGLFGFGKKNQGNAADGAGSSPVQIGKKWLVQYDRKGCIGAGSCEAVNLERWTLLDERKAEMKGAEPNRQNNMYEVRIGDDEIAKMKAAAEGCPKIVIHIINTETGEKVI